MFHRILWYSLTACTCLLAFATRALAQTISGEVIEDATTQPLRGYQVRLFYLGQGDSTRAIGQGDSTRAIDSTTTDDRGLFQFGGQGPGRYRLDFGPTGSRLVSSARVEADAGDMMTAVRYRVPVLAMGGAQAFAKKDVQQVANPRTVVALRYPEDLRSIGLSGEVLVRFIVEPSGSMRPGSLQVVRSSHPSFTRSVTEALRTMKFDPARIGGIAVPQLVEEPFTFAMDRGR